MLAGSAGENRQPFWSSPRDRRTKTKEASQEQQQNKSLTLMDVYEPEDESNTPLTAPVEDTDDLVDRPDSPAAPRLDNNNGMITSAVEPHTPTYVEMEPSSYVLSPPTRLYQKIIGNPAVYYVASIPLTICAVFAILFMGFHTGLCTTQWIAACVQSTVLLPTGILLLVWIFVGCCIAPFNGIQPAKFTWIGGIGIVNILYFIFLVIHYVQESKYYGGPWYLKVASDLIWTFYCCVVLFFSMVAVVQMYVRSLIKRFPKSQRTSTTASITSEDIAIEDDEDPTGV